MRTDGFKSYDAAFHTSAILSPSAHTPPGALPSDSWDEGVLGKTGHSAGSAKCGMALMICDPVIQSLSWAIKLKLGHSGFFGAWGVGRPPNIEMWSHDKHRNRIGKAGDLGNALTSTANPPTTAKMKLWM